MISWNDKTRSSYSNAWIKFQEYFAEGDTNINDETLENIKNNENKIERTMKKRKWICPL